MIAYSGAECLSDELRHQRIAIVPQLFDSAAAGGSGGGKANPRERVPYHSTSFSWKRSQGVGVTIRAGLGRGWGFGLSVAEELMIGDVLVVVTALLGRKLFQPSSSNRGRISSCSVEALLMVRKLATFR